MVRGIPDAGAQALLGGADAAIVVPPWLHEPDGGTVEGRRRHDAERDMVAQRTCRYMRSMSSSYISSAGAPRRGSPRPRSASVVAHELAADRPQRLVHGRDLGEDVGAVAPPRPSCGARGPGPRCAEPLQIRVHRRGIHRERLPAGPTWVPVPQAHAAPGASLVFALAIAPPHNGVAPRNRRRPRLFVTAHAAPRHRGAREHRRSKGQTGYSTPAAIRMPTTLYANARRGSGASSAWCGATARSRRRRRAGRGA